MSDRDPEPEVSSEGMVVDPCLWGKQRGLPVGRTYPVVCHLLDTAGVAGALWDALLPQAFAERVAQEIGVAVDEARKIIMFWAGLHDIGKISIDFQGLVTEAFTRLAENGSYTGVPAPRGERLAHDAATHRGLAPLLRELGYPSSSRLPKTGVDQQIAQLLGGHHGRFHPHVSARQAATPQAYAPGLGGGEWDKQRRVHVRELRRLTGAHNAPATLLTAPAAVVVHALVVLADWLASQEKLVLARLPEAKWAGSPTDLNAHWEVAVAKAPAVVAAAGLGRVSTQRTAFSDQFPFPPNPLQESLERELPELVTGPGLLLITAPPGDGKTEAALHGATVLGVKAGVPGLCFALPTMATADHMYGRVRDFARCNLDGAPSLTLLHSMAWLSDVYAEALPHSTPDAGPILVGGRDATSPTTWLRGGLRGLVAALSVVTIDQILAGVLPVRHNALRLFGASSKVVVIDEAHAYGPWMHTLLLKLLQWLGAAGTPVVVMSATLTGRTAASLVDAYRAGAGHRSPLPKPLQPHYPGWLFVNAADGTVSEPRAVKSNRERGVRFTTVDVRHDVEAEHPASRAAVIREKLAGTVLKEGCALLICTTVAEAQRTYDELRTWFATLADPPELRLLHSRFPAWIRASRTRQAEKTFGKAADNGDAVRPRSVLVATQVIEQSVDLDFDMVISDLAPVAQLLQRSGRCWRHDRERRPQWVNQPTVLVLRPVGRNRQPCLPKAWGEVYDEGLLRRTHRELDSYQDKDVEIPGGVQALVEAVYEEVYANATTEEAERLARLDVARAARDGAEAALADMVTVPSPQDCRDLSRLNGAEEVDPDLITTRLGADSGRILCLHTGADGSRNLDREGKQPLPTPSRDGRFSRDQVAQILGWAVPVPGRWLRGRTSKNAAPESWAKQALLAELVLVEVKAEADKTCGSIGKRVIEIRSSGDISSPME